MALRTMVTVAIVSMVAAAAFAQDGQAAKAAEAIKSLQQGGYVIVMTPGDTDKEEWGGKPALSLKNCSSQPSLSDFGRMSATAFGRLLVKEHVRVGALYTSRFCRSSETAARVAEQLHASKFVPVTELDDATSKATTSAAPERMAKLRILASSTPGRGANTLVVTHPANLQEAFGDELANLAEGEIAIFKPGAGTSTLAYRVLIKDLSAYLREQKAAAAKG